MFKAIFNNTIKFTILYSVVLVLDVVVKIVFSLDNVTYRFFTKPLVIITLLVFYMLNSKDKNSKKHKFMVVALVLYLMGDLFYIIKNNLFFTIATLFFAFAKVFYILRFSNGNDFKIKRIVPFLILCFLYIIFIMFFVYENLGDSLYSTVVYVFIMLLTFLFALLRKGAVNRKSYILVLFGVAVSVLTDSVAVLEMFYHKYKMYNNVVSMVLYGVSQYLIVLGIVSEVEIKYRKLRAG